MNQCRILIPEVKKSDLSDLNKMPPLHYQFLKRALVLWKKANNDLENVEAVRKMFKLLPSSQT